MEHTILVHARLLEVHLNFVVLACTEMTRRMGKRW